MRILVPYLILTVVLLSIDTYAFQAVRTALRDADSRRVFYYLYWGLSTLSIVGITAMFFTPLKAYPRWLVVYFIGYLLLMLLGKLFVVFFLAIDDITRLFRWIFAAATHEENYSISRARFLSQMGLFAAAVPVGLGLYGIIKDAYNYKVHRLQIAIKGLPESFRGFKIVQLSDIHSGSLVRHEPIARAMKTINALGGDVILFTGDLVNEDAEEMEPLKQYFSQLKAPEGVFATLGNHDYGRNKAKWGENLARIDDMHRQLGWELIRNETRLIKRGNDTIAIIGVDNTTNKGYFPSTGDLTKAKRGSETASAKILMSHDPTHWDMEVNQGQHNDIDLTLAGHTHGAQLGIETPTFRWSPSKYVYPRWAGLYKENDQQLYVNRGFGFLAFPGRIGILPEITLLELVPA